VFNSFVTMRGTALAATAALLLALVGCGGDGTDSQEQAVSDAYVAYIDAVKASDGKLACSMTTPAFQRRAGRAVAVGPRANLKSASCVQAIDQGTIAAIQQVEPNLEQIEITGNRASGLDPGEPPIGAQEVFFVRSGGEWKIDRTRFYKRPQQG
jgi:hypothetical protein